MEELGLITRDERHAFLDEGIDRRNAQASQARLNKLQYEAAALGFILQKQ
jgi:hypothetical protein